MTEEKNFSVNFSLFHPSGVKMQYTARADTEAEHEEKVDRLIDRLFALGYSKDEPVANAGVKLYRIVGYVMSMAKDRNAGKNMPCVYLYNDVAAFQYKCATVYHEKLGELPIGYKVKEFPGGIVAPTRDIAKEQGYWNDCDFTVEMEPQLDYDTGEPKVNDNGNIIYKYARLHGKAQPVVQATEIVHRNIATDAHAELDNLLDEAEALDFDTIPGAVTDAQKIEALGLALYGGPNEWNVGRIAWVKKLTQNAKLDIAKLTDAEMTKLLGGLESTTRNKYDKQVDVLYQAGVQVPNVDPDECFGLALAHAYIQLCKLAVPA